MDPREAPPSSEIQSMSHWWAERAHLASGAQSFFEALQKEEGGKSARLAALARDIALPTYPTAAFSLPSELAAFGAHCREIAADGVWSVALKIVDETGRAIFRRLGLGAEAAVSAADSAKGLALVTPYRDPELSGTLWLRDGGLVVEISRGPHFWLTKWAPAEDCVLRGRASALDPRLKFDGDLSETDREQVSRIVSSAGRALFGCSVTGMLTLDTRVYAEFHWFRAFGIRFIECSFSRAWTD